MLMADIYSLSSVCHMDNTEKLILKKHKKTVTHKGVCEKDPEHLWEGSLIDVESCVGYNVFF